VYGDRCATVDPRDLLDRLRARAARVARAAPGLRRHSGVVELLLEAGELTQAVLDSELAGGGCDRWTPAARASGALLRALGAELCASVAARFDRRGNLEATLAKNMSHNIQGTVSVTRQWQRVSGTWGPTDPARFIQPAAFDNNRDLSQYLFGNGDTNSLSGGGRESGVAYRPYSLRMAGQYLAPWSLRVGLSYVIQAGGWVGPVVTQLAAADPVFGPALIRLADGTTQSNPLATTIRFCGSSTVPCAANPVRSNGQTRNEDERYMQLQLSREFPIGSQRLEAGLGIFNLFNNGAQTQWNTGANQIYSPNYLSRFNRTSSRQLQLNFRYRF